MLFQCYSGRVSSIPTFEKNSKSRYFTLSFHSDGSVQQRGFNIQWKLVWQIQIFKNRFDKYRYKYKKQIWQLQIYQAILKMCHPLLCLCLCDYNMDSFSTNKYVYFKSLLRKLYFKSFLRKLSFKYLSIQLMSILLFLSAHWWQNLRLFLFSASLFSTVIMTKKFRFLNWKFIFFQISLISAIVTKEIRFLDWTF